MATPDGPRDHADVAAGVTRAGVDLSDNAIAAALLDVSRADIDRIAPNN